MTIMRLARINGAFKSFPREIPNQKHVPASLPSNHRSSIVVQRFSDQVAALNQNLAESEKKRFLAHERILAERQSTIELIERVICKAGQSRLVKVGSLCTHLAVHNTSDIDLCFLPNDPQFFRDFYMNPDFRHVFMRVVAEQLQRLEQIDPGLALRSEIVFLHHTRPALLMAFFENGITMDVQFTERDYHALRNTNLIRYYSAADVRFRQVHLWLKTLFTKLGVKNSKDGLLSSYHIVLLVVHFLQARATPPVLPILARTHPHLVGPHVPVEQVLEGLEKPFDGLIDWKSENKMGAAELAIELIDYYSRFQSTKKAIHIGKGSELSRRQYAHNNQLLLLYDPYSTSSVARSNLIPDALFTTTTYIRKGQEERGDFIDSFPDFPEAKRFRYSVQNKEFRPNQE